MLLCIYDCTQSQEVHNQGKKNSTTTRKTSTTTKKTSITTRKTSITTRKTSPTNRKTSITTRKTRPTTRRTSPTTRKTSTLGFNCPGCCALNLVHGKQEICECYDPKCVCLTPSYCTCPENCGCEEIGDTLSCIGK